MFFKIVVLENFAILTGTHLCWSLFLINLLTFRSTTCNVFYRTRPVATSEGLKCELQNIAQSWSISTKILELENDFWTTIYALTSSIFQKPVKFYYFSDTVNRFKKLNYCNCWLDIKEMLDKRSFWWYPFMRRSERK